jgi:hypothetical protein
MNLDNLIDDLSKAPPQRPKVKPAALFFGWFVASAIYLALILCLFGVRSDISAKIGANLFTYEILSLLAVIVGVAVSSIILSYPDLCQKKWLVYLPMLPLAAFLYIMYISYNSEVDKVGYISSHGAGLECFACICLFSIGPAFLMLRYLRKQATTHPRLTSGLAVLSSTAFGALVFRFCEKTDSITHLITAHYLPLLGFAIAGVLLGKKLLRW